MTSRTFSSNCTDFVRLWRFSPHLLGFPKWPSNVLSHAALISLAAISCIEKFLPVFVRFCPIWPIFSFLPVLYTSSGTTGDKNSQESLEIIIYIQTASHKNFSMWWRGFGLYQNLLSHALKNFCAFLCIFVRFGRFGRSCQLCTLLRAPLGQQTARKVWKL